jgi:hypothetical protein
LIVHDDDHLLFSNIASPRTVANLRLDPRIEINCVDIFSRQVGLHLRLRRLIESQVNDGPKRIYRAGESWYETSGAHHAVKS